MFHTTVKLQKKVYRTLAREKASPRSTYDLIDSNKKYFTVNIFIQVLGETQLLSINDRTASLWPILKLHPTPLNVTVII